MKSGSHPSAPVTLSWLRVKSETEQRTPLRKPVRAPAPVARGQSSPVKRTASAGPWKKDIKVWNIDGHKILALCDTVDDLREQIRHLTDSLRDTYNEGFTAGCDWSAQKSRALAEIEGEK